MGPVVKFSPSSRYWENNITDQPDPGNSENKLSHSYWHFSSSQLRISLGHARALPPSATPCSHSLTSGTFLTLLGITKRKETFRPKRPTESLHDRIPWQKNLCLWQLGKPHEKQDGSSCIWIQLKVGSVPLPGWTGLHFNPRPSWGSGGLNPRPKTAQVPLSPPETN